MTSKQQSLINDVNLLIEQSKQFINLAEKLL